ncbi:MAG: HU family DNA-binding protein [Clostridia bacterium]|nr:HU family DNA-binding protein [Clostridia bacterium]
MNRTEFSAALAKKLGVTKKEADATALAVVELLKETLAAGEKIQLAGLGIFEVKTRAARNTRNPRTGETVSVPERKVVTFKPAAAL